MKRILTILAALALALPAFAAHRLENKTTTIVVAADQPALTYVDLLRIVASVPPKEGANYESQRKRFRILDACDAAKGAPAITLEDADYDEMLPLVLAHPWGAYNKEILGFMEAFKSAPKIELEKKSP